MNPNNKLPLSPKNILGNLKSEKLKHKKTHIGIVKMTHKICDSWLARKYKMDNTEINAKLTEPSSPSK
jgi:hypothetical protein